FQHDRQRLRVHARRALRDHRRGRSSGADRRSVDEQAGVNLLEQQAANRRRTLVVMAAFVAFLAFLGAGFDVFVLGAGQVYVPVGTVAALAIGLVSSWITLRNGDR